MASKADYLKKYLGPSKRRKSSSGSRGKSSGGLVLGDGEELDIRDSAKKKGAARTPPAPQLYRVMKRALDGKSYVYVSDGGEEEEGSDSEDDQDGGVVVVDAAGMAMDLQPSHRKKIRKILAQDEGRAPPAHPLASLSVGADGRVVFAEGVLQKGSDPQSRTSISQSSAVERRNELWKKALAIAPEHTPVGTWASGRAATTKPSTLSLSVKQDGSEVEISRAFKHASGTQDTQPVDPDISPPRRSAARPDISPPRRSAARPDISPPRRSGAVESCAPTNKLEEVSSKSKAPKDFQKGDSVIREARSGGVVFRDRQGRIIEEEEWLTLEKLEWGGGLKQIEEQEKRRRDEEEIAKQPFTQYDISAAYDRELRERVRWEDPLKRAEEKESEDNVVESAPQRPICPHDAPPNRFGIKPGYRWDGVVRGNGFEERRFEKLQRRKWEAEAAHMNNTADM